MTAKGLRHRSGGGCSEHDRAKMATREDGHGEAP
jgi:hypothetical protein